MGQMTIYSNLNTIAPMSQNESFTTQTFDIHLVQSQNMNNAQQPRGKKKNKQNNYAYGKGTSPN
jgi:hypothetical protein